MTSDELVKLQDLHVMLDLLYILEKNAITAPFVHREFAKKRGRQKWSANVTRTFEQSTFNDPHNA